MPTSAEPNGDGRVEIPPDLLEALKTRLRGSAFPSVESFVLFVIARLAESRSGSPFSEEEEAKLKERLRGLGYLD
jgi:hypothetical protein